MSKKAKTRSSVRNDSSLAEPTRLYSKMMGFLADDPETSGFYARKLAENVCRILSEEFEIMVSDKAHLEEVLRNIQSRLPGHVSDYFRSAQTHGNRVIHDQPGMLEREVKNSSKLAVDAAKHIYDWFVKAYPSHCTPLSTAQRAQIRKTTKPADSKGVSQAIPIEKDISVAELSESIGVGTLMLLGSLLRMGIVATPNQILEHQTAKTLASYYGIKVVRAR